jgi:hypothetical protein
MSSEKGTAAVPGRVYLTVELLPGYDLITGTVSHRDGSDMTSFRGWMGLIVGISQLWRQAVTDITPQIPEVNARCDVESDRNA